MQPLIFIGVMVVLMYVLLIAPQRRRQAAQRRILEDVSVGDEVLTAGGVYATVQAVREDDLTVEIAPGTSVRLDKRAVALVLSEDDSADGEAEPAETAEDEEPTEAART
ncbi:MAG: preprotein translocase subunit YajC [Gaiellaceae bacterium]